VDVLPPQYDIVSGLGADSEGFPNMVNPLRFEVYCTGDRPMGGQPDGYPEERIVRPQSGFDSGWVGPGPDFYYEGGAIIDIKRTDVDPQTWNNIAIGAVLDDFIQHTRFIVKDCHGLNTAFTLGTRWFQRVKSSASSVKIVQI
jgi:hypothetical protein